LAPDRGRRRKLRVTKPAQQTFFLIGSKKIRFSLAFVNKWEPDVSVLVLVVSHDE